jgi:hypothetical protein
MSFLTNQNLDKKRKSHDRKRIPQILRETVWRRDYGSNTDGICKICNFNTISVFRFHCAHVCALSENGPNVAENLFPICDSCNLSMGTENMEAFHRRYKQSAHLQPPTSEQLNDLCTKIKRKKYEYEQLKEWFKLSKEECKLDASIACLKKNINITNEQFENRVSELKILMLQKENDDLQKKNEANKTKLQRLNEKENVRLQELEAGCEAKNIVVEQQAAIHEKDMKILVLESDLKLLKDRQEDNMQLTTELSKARAQIHRHQKITKEHIEHRPQNFQNSCRYCGKPCRKEVCNMARCKSQRNIANRKRYEAKLLLAKKQKV